MQLTFNGMTLDGIDDLEWVTEEMMAPSAIVTCQCTGWIIMQHGCQCGFTHTCQCSAFDKHNFGCRCKKQKEA